MRPIIATALLASALSLSLAPVAQAADSYTLDPTHTNIIWMVNHFGFSNPSGKLTKTEGTVTLDEAKPENSKVTVTIDMASGLTGIEKLDAHLKGKDFFNTEKFPTASFVSDKVEVTTKDAAKVTGTLTLRGISKPVVLNVKLNKIGENMMKKKTAGFSATTTVKRSDFGMSYGAPGLGDDVTISIEAEANLS
jgi:polyisoprenoid-binding protein YceI